MRYSTCDEKAAQPVLLSGRDLTAWRHSWPRPFLALAVFLAIFPAFAGVTQGLKVGDAFPDLTRFQLEGQLPGTLKGRVILVDLWASWCLPCKESFPMLRKLHQRYTDRGLVIIAVSVDEQKGQMERFLEKNPAPFAVVRDATQKLAGAVNARTMPASFLLDQEGRVRFVHDGFTAETGRAYEKEIEELLQTSSKGRNP